MRALWVVAECWSLGVVRVNDGPENGQSDVDSRVKYVLSDS